MRIALDATYSFGDALSGVGVYSREILYGLAASNVAERWEWFYRSHRYWKALRLGKPANVRTRLLTETWGSRSADLFHGLNQRLPRRRFRRNIATFHDLFVLSGEYSTPEFRTRFAGQARDASNSADLIIAVSEFTARQVEAFLNVPRSRIRIVHHGVIPRHLPDLPRENVVLCVGAIQKRKNQAGLVRAFGALPREWTLVLAGSEGFGASETAEAIAASPARDRIRVTGYLSESELAGWYSRASIFAFPSFDEGFGMPVLEAMAAGLPVVASNGSALPEVAGDAALLIDPNRDEQLVAALNLLAANPQKRLALAEQGRERARAFTWARAVTETADIYRELL